MTCQGTVKPSNIWKYLLTHRSRLPFLLSLETQLVKSKQPTERMMHGFLKAFQGLNSECAYWGQTDYSLQDYYIITCLLLPKSTNHTLQKPLTSSFREGLFLRLKYNSQLMLIYFSFRFHVHFSLCFTSCCIWHVFRHITSKSTGSHI